MFYLLWYPGNVPRKRFVPDSSPSEFGRRRQEDPSELAHHGCTETVRQTGERTVGKVGVRDGSERQTDGEMRQTRVTQVGTLMCDRVRT